MTARLAPIQGIFSTTPTDGDDVIYGTDDSDILHGLKGNDRISAGNGNDSLFGDEGRDTLYGSAGDNMFNGGAGNDSINAYDFRDDSDAIDTATFSSNAANYKITWQDADIVTGPLGSALWQETYIIVEDKTGVDGSDRITGVEALKFKNVTLYWNGHGYGSQIKFTPGDDSVSGGSEGDQIHAGSGNDYIKGNAGDDIISGGAGNDKLDGGDDTDYIVGGTGDDRLMGGRGADHLSDSDGANTLYGGEGDDYIGNDSSVNGYLYGEVGNDTLEVAGGMHFVSGGEGDDVLWTFSGYQKLHGNAGNDKFLFNSDKTTGSHIIKDFVSGEDTVVIQGDWMLSYDDVSHALSTNSAGDAVLSFETGGKVTFQGIAPDMLYESDFSFTL